MGRSGTFISQQPANQSVTAGQPAMFSVTAGGAGTLTYQWRRDTNLLTDGGAISGSTTGALSISAASAADAGSYDCVISNGCGAKLSLAATLTVETPPAVPPDSSGNSTACGTCGAGATMMMPLMLLCMAITQRQRRAPSPRYN
jgi:hypothetical protein